MKIFKKYAIPIGIASCEYPYTMAWGCPTCGKGVLEKYSLCPYCGQRIKFRKLKQKDLCKKKINDLKDKINCLEVQNRLANFEYELRQKSAKQSRQSIANPFPICYNNIGRGKKIKTRVKL